MEVTSSVPRDLLGDDNSTVASLYNATGGGPHGVAGNGSSVPCGSENFVPNTASSVAYLMIASSGIVGNLLVIVVIVNFDAMKKWFTNILILNQSAIDLFTSVIMMTIAVMPRRPQQRHLEGFVDEFLCRVWYSPNPLWSAIVASSYNLIAIACERYLAVVHPFMYRSRYTAARARAACAMAWLVFLIVLGCTTTLHDGRCCLLAASITTSAARTANGLSALLFTFLLPTAVYVFCYTVMYRALRRPAVAPAELPASGPAAQREARMRRIRRNLFVTQLTVVISFMVCWSVNQVLYGAFNLGFAVDFSAPLYHVSVVLVFANCCVNPFIYAFKYELFQTGLRKLFCRRHSDDTETYEANVTTTAKTTTTTTMTTTTGVRF